ncbi:transcriptional regulator [Alkalilimnicola ehrlichii]|uniref:Transcriptional regulator n=1 Tax=Alkalilimnicola ehrlichii TaxID=351052 RepID=A0A3E0WHL5_9GAMM|nr:transcriptional regulator [Alkalilimnicola ehrlichii]RFA24630.1 transcriptional regulator [Alkalilimnicola ehrlichii]RFA31723.1 transcriptional regulator [Alkalilimnicola ehrlichii]
MKFAALVAILADDLEEKAIESAKAAGAGGVTILDARGIGTREKKSFFGITYEGSQSVLLFVLEKKLSVTVLKRLTQDLELDKHSKGVVFTLPLEHIAGIDVAQIEHFETQLKDKI